MLYLQCLLLNHLAVIVLIISLFYTLQIDKIWSIIILSRESTKSVQDLKLATYASSYLGEKIIFLKSLMCYLDLFTISSTN